MVGRSYGRLLALLAAQCRDITAAEDALADAMERAVGRWPRDGVPGNPEAWLLTVARNRLRDMWKSPAHRLSGSWTEDRDVAEEVTGPAAIPDRRLELMLVCAHPAISADIRTPLMLQTVLGVDAAAIAAAFAVAPATMAQRLVRAKKRIRDTGIPFTLPERTDLAARLPEVLEAVYGAYSIDWLSVPQRPAIESLSSEALHLAMVLVELLPEEPEVLGLAALMCLCEARRPARIDREGTFVALDDQDRGRWDAELYARGEHLLARAHGFGRPGRFQYEAAIQSAHCATGTERHALRKLYRALMRVGPSLGAAVALAVLDGEIDGADAGLHALDAITGRAAEGFQPAWVTRGHLLGEAGRAEEAAAAYHRAIELTADDSVRAYLNERVRGLASGDSIRRH
ncbi:RNA polymerase sigma factor [Mycolicibacterium septicum]|uniref:RNA polymerase sigma factor n=1 Tax=Mycolicibacterium septicum TaxID=98668 RepID=A0ABW9LV80_9MYCO